MYFITRKSYLRETVLIRAPCPVYNAGVSPDQRGRRPGFVQGAESLEYS